MECKFQVGDRAVTLRHVIPEKFRSLTCRIVGIEDDMWVEVEFDEDPYGERGGRYKASTSCLMFLSAECHTEEIADFLDNM